MSIATRIQSLAPVTETLEDDSVAASNQTVLMSGFDQDSGNLNSGSGVPVTHHAQFTGALVAAADTIDLTSLISTNGAVISGSGKKVQFFRVKNLGANSMTFKFGAADAYNLVGSDWTVTLEQNQYFEVWGNDATPDIGAGAKDIDVSGTGTQTYEATIIMG